MTRPKKSALPFLPSDPIAPVLDYFCFPGSGNSERRLKVQGVLDRYAEHSGTTPGKLRVMDVFNFRAELKPALLRFIEALPRARTQTERRLKQYKREIRANLKHIGRICFGLPGPKSQNRAKADQVTRDLPEQLLPILPYLSREAWQMKASAQPLVQPLTDKGLLQLSALLKVWNARNPASLESLLVDFSREIIREFRALSPRSPREMIKNLLNQARRGLGFKMPPAQRSSVRKEDWPLKLRQEWELFESRARAGIVPEHELALEAERLGFSVKPLSTATLDALEDGLSQALGVIPHDDNLGILDLITVVRRPGAPGPDQFEDDGIPRTHNALADLFRASEQAKEGLVKRVGYDSNAFQNFIQAVKGVAVRIGHGKYVKAFRAAYQLRLDKAAMERRKAEKKEGLPLAWVDQEIAHLAPQFDRIVRSGSFKRKPARIKQADRDLYLVLFFVWFVTMRYMGYRQGSLVSCEIGKNFILKSDGSIVLKFDQTKNGKRLFMELNGQRRVTHGLLWDTLTLYYQKVYPHLVRQSGNTLGGRLFVTTARRDGSYRRFHSSSDFDDSFYGGRDNFLRLDDLADHMRSKLNPHFLRGLCTDWMIIVLHMTFDEAGEVLGDDPSMLKKRYVNKHRVHDAGAAFDAANARNQLVLEHATLSGKFDESIKRIERTFNTQVKQKEEELVAVRRQLEDEKTEHAATKLALEVLRETLGHRMDAGVAY